MNIGELATVAGTTVRAIHHYEAVGLLDPDRTSNGYRMFQADDLRRVHVIHRLQSVDFSLAEIRDLAPCWRLGRTISETQGIEMRCLYEAKLATIVQQLEALDLVRNELHACLALLDTTVEPKRTA